MFSPDIFLEKIDGGEGTLFPCPKIKMEIKKADFSAHGGRLRRGEQIMGLKMQNTLCFLVSWGKKCLLFEFLEHACVCLFAVILASKTFLPQKLPPIAMFNPILQLHVCKNQFGPKTIIHIGKIILEN